MRSFVGCALVVAAWACSGSTDVFGTGQPTGGSGGANGSTGITVGPGAGGGATSSTASSSAMSSSAMSSSAMSSSAMSSSGSGMDPCGNGAIDAGEACDDGNKDAKDGCTGCMLDGAADACPTGEVITLKKAIVIASTTSGKANFTAGFCGGTFAPDMAFQVMPSKSAPVAIKLVTPANFDRVLVVRSTCTQGFTPDPVCIDNNTTLTTTVQQAMQGQAFFVIVTGHQQSSGPFTLTITY